MQTALNVRRRGELGFFSNRNSIPVDLSVIEGIETGSADLVKDGIIELRELDTFVSEKVKELTGGRQHPTTVKPSTISRFPVARVK